MSTNPTSEPTLSTAGSRAWAIAAFVAGWLVPGLGHALLRRWTRAAVFFVAIVALAAAGVWLRGSIFGPHPADPFERLGFLADLGTGLLYPAARSLGIASDVSHAAGDYGTRFFAAAGALNLLCAFDAYTIGTGRKR
ncbi:MAG TPA: DUF6677 family protein [Candidatus Acidoferrales bacterium]|nr:DUF6677 family protein [Candidatus Acidoferrales bacterium]